MSTIATEETSQVVEIETKNSTDPAAPDEKTSSNTGQGDVKEVIEEHVTVLTGAEVPRSTRKYWTTSLHTVPYVRNGKFPKHRSGRRHGSTSDNGGATGGGALNLEVEVDTKFSSFAANL